MENCVFDKTSICEACIKGKHKIHDFPTSQTRSSRLLEIIHCDVCGSINTVSLGGLRFFVTFIDDYSRKTFTFLLKQKFDVFEKLKEFKALVENETSKKIFTIRLDNGGEFCSSAFVKFYKVHGIKKETITHTPQHNGVAERYNCTLTEMARAMMFETNLDYKFWGEAVVFFTNILNCLSCKALKSTTPYEVWTRIKPDISLLKSFGCKAFFHVPDEIRMKLEPKSIECIFLGISKTSKVYRFYNPKTHKLVKSRNAIFCEEKKEIEEPILETPTNLDGSDSDSDTKEDTPPLRRSTRVRKPPVRFVDSGLLL